MVKKWWKVLEMGKVEKQGKKFYCRHQMGNTEFYIPSSKITLKKFASWMQKNYGTVVNLVKS